MVYIDPAELSDEGIKIVEFYEHEVRRLQGVLSLLLWDYSGVEGSEDIIRVVSDELGHSLKRVRDFNEEDH